MHFFWGGDTPHYSPSSLSGGAEGGACACWPASLGAWFGGRGCARWLVCPGPHPWWRPRTCALAGGPAHVPGAGVAVVPAGWRGQARAPGRGRVRARWPAGQRPCPARGSRTGTARLRMGVEEECARTGDSNPGCNYPVRGYSPSMQFFCAPLFSSPPFFSGVFHFLDRYISLARNIGYVTIKPMTKYCPVFMLSLADVQ